MQIDHWLLKKWKLFPQWKWEKLFNKYCKIKVWLWLWKMSVLTISLKKSRHVAKRYEHSSSWSLRKFAWGKKQMLAIILKDPNLRCSLSALNSIRWPLQSLFHIGFALNTRRLTSQLIAKIPFDCKLLQLEQILALTRYSSRDCWPLTNYGESEKKK